jgi:hypothetical protein
MSIKALLIQEANDSLQPEVNTSSGHYYNWQLMAENFQGTKETLQLLRDHCMSGRNNFFDLWHIKRSLTHLSLSK